MSLGHKVNFFFISDLPKVSETISSFKDNLKKIASAYNNQFWFPEKGFGTEQNPGAISPRVPGFLKRFVKENSDDDIAKSLKEKLNWCYKQYQDKNKDENKKEKLIQKGQNLIEYQNEDGSFDFDPEGRHFKKDDFVVIREIVEPMGIKGDTALDLCVRPAIQLLKIADSTGENQFKIAAKKALDYCMDMKRPEGGDYWETPLHSPNLLAGGHAAIAYYLGYEMFDNKDYKVKAIYWIRSLLPFTHLWEPENKKMKYNTKPCFASSDWYFANWVRDHVQWEMLEVFATSSRMEINWNQIDPEINWHKFHNGITSAAINWLIDHNDDSWRPHNKPETLEPYREGKFDLCFPDTHNCVTDNYGGMVILPEAIADNIYGILDNEK